MRCFVTWLWTAALMFHLPAFAQKVEVSLTERTTEDTQLITFIALSKVPAEPLTLPAVDTTQAFYTSVYSRQIKGNELISILVLPDDQGEWLYIDLNNDEDLTNDGAPRYFSANENEIISYLNATTDPNQVVGRALYRIPPFILGDVEREARFRKHVVDDSGNLRSTFLEHVPKIPPDFTGQAGTFYFLGRHSLSRGRVLLDREEFAIGLYDYSENGRFDDQEDLLYLDLNRDEKLGILWTTEIFKLNDVFEIRGEQYKLSHVDHYGRSLRLIPTDEALTAYYVAEMGATFSAEATEGHLAATFWELELESIKEERIELADLKGQYLLLNFWGEWCAPCIEEIPALVAIDEEMPDERLQVIGMLSTYDQAAAEKVVHEQGIQWPQVILTEELQERFKVQGFPTNLLIFPDGETYLQAGQINEEFIRQNVK